MNSIPLYFYLERDKHMLKNYNGFSMLEILCSFSIILTSITVIIPIIMKTYEERAVIDYKREALLLSHNEKESYLYDSSYQAETKTVKISSRTYQISIQGEGELTKICVQWEVPWDKKGKICNYAKK